MAKRSGNHASSAACSRAGSSIAKPGKRIGNDLYVHVDALNSLDSEFQERARRAIAIAQCSLSEISVIRFSLSMNELSLLDYPAFFEDAFPVLARSWTVLLDGKGTAQFRAYTDSLNPPILHRKELMLALDDPRRKELSQITREAETIGLFDDLSGIGFKNAWDGLTASKGYRLDGSHFVPIGNAHNSSEARQELAPEQFSIARHLTALTRYNFSAPIQALARGGFLSRGWKFFDYGCGKGDDVRSLRQNGVEAFGWDPYFAPEEAKRRAEIVNLGFVINVIEDVAERCDAIRRSFQLTTKLLSVGVMLHGSSPTNGRVYRDGFLSGRGTFQKYFAQSELKDFIDETLGEESLLVAPGIAFVFADKEEEQRFLFSRQRSVRTLRWVAVGERRDSVPQRRISTPDLYEAHHARFDALWHYWLKLGRLAAREEATEFEDLFSAIGSFQRTCTLLRQRRELSSLATAALERMDDLRVYFALERFARRRPYQQLSATIQLDIKAFFGTLRNCQDEAERLLHNIADTAQIETACRAASEKGLGHHTPGESLLLHSSLVPRLPPLLRVYVGAASALYGDVSSADLVKIHVQSGKLTVLEFDAFHESAVPRLRRRVKIKMRTQDFDLFEYGGRYEPTVLLGKSRFINEEFPQYAEQLQFDAALKELGLFAWDEHGPTESAFNRSLCAARRSVEGYKLSRAATIPSLDEPCGRYFRYRDLVECGETQRATGVPNVPKEPESYNALYDLAAEIVDPTVEYFGNVKLTYAFASPELVKAIHGRIAPKLDQHVACERTPAGERICSRGGAAVDLLVEHEDMIEVAAWIAENLRFDRLYVYGPDRPIHVSFALEQAREIVRIERRGSRVIPRRLFGPAGLRDPCRAR